MSSILLSCLIASDNPKDLANFYASINQASRIGSLGENHYVLEYNDGYKLQFFKPSRSRAPFKRGKTVSLCFQKPASENPMKELRKWIDLLVNFGSVLEEKPRIESFGAEAWLSDLDGNSFLIFVPVLKAEMDNE